MKKNNCNYGREERIFIAVFFKRLTLVKHIRRSIFLWMLFYFSPAVALECHVTVTKANCWENYNVDIDMHFSSDTGSARIAALSKKSPEHPALFETIIKLPCKKGDRLIYSGKYNPAIWDNDKGSPELIASQQMGVPMDLPANVNEFHLAICHPRDFSDVPYPMEYTTKCVCPEREDKKK